MKITKYGLRMADNLTNMLVSEEIFDYDGGGGTHIKFDDPQKITRLMCNIFECDRRVEECIWALAFDSAFRIIGVFEIAVGGQTQCLVDAKALYTRLLLCGAFSFVVVHNHPGGTAVPSKKDLELTTKLKEGSKLIGLNLLDHLVIPCAAGGVGESYFSFRENQLL